MEIPQGYHRHSNGGGLVQDTATVAETAYIGPNAQVSGNAQVYGNARVYGNALVSEGHWSVSPLQIQGSRDLLNICAPGVLKIGCYEHPIDYWLENYGEIGKENGYSESEMEEYFQYICLAHDLFVAGNPTAHGA